MIDLHTHTWYSDGTLSPTQLVHMAKKKGIHTLAITDHDGAYGLQEGKKAAEECGIRFICGIEFSAMISGEQHTIVQLAADPEPATKFVSHPDSTAKLAADLDSDIRAKVDPNLKVKAAEAKSLILGEGSHKDCPRPVYMHILGYGFDPENTELRRRVDQIRDQRKVRNEKMIKVLSELGFPLTKNDLEVYPGQDYIGKPNFARALALRGYAADVQEAFSSEKMMASPQIKAIHRDKIEAEEAIRLIRGAGGFAALAHPYKISYDKKWEDKPEIFRKKLESTIAALKQMGMEGIECYYSSHSPQQEQDLLALAEKYKLKVTSGSDYHGPGMKKNVELGGIHGS